VPSWRVRAHYLQHEPQEGLGSIGGWLAQRDFAIRGTMLHENEPLPRVSDFDLLIIMGGGMSANDDDRLPWLRGEKQLLRAALDADKKVLGICLGAQLISAALGSPDYGNAHKEIGWHPIRDVATGADKVFRFPSACEAFHWHGETFDLPKDAVHLAESEACRNQAFQIGRQVIGLQFHLETTPETARQFVSTGRPDLAPGPYVQTEEEILSAPPEKYRELNKLMAGVLSHLTGAS
jgi:GMP synthase-like glutamine amidotransferase